MGKYSGGSRVFFLSIATLTLVGAAAVQAAAPGQPAPVAVPAASVSPPPSPAPRFLARSAAAYGSPEALFARMDRNHDQQLSPEEFKAGLKTRGRPVVYQRLPVQFRAVDIDHSGFLEAGEFDTLPIIQDAGADAPSLASVDTTPDARIDFREYVALVVQLDSSKN
ncbi:MAG: hypothetical protein WC213_05065 [Arenimonas sp.]|jgi:hypothetical protein